MIIKRVPLFILGLLYGYIIQPILGGYCIFILLLLANVLNGILQACDNGKKFFMRSMPIFGIALAVGLSVTIIVWLLLAGGVGINLVIPLTQGALLAGLITGLSIGAQAAGIFIGAVITPLILYTIGKYIIIWPLIDSVYFLALFIKGRLLQGWHCALAFYDEGLLEGLTFPFFRDSLQTPCIQRENHEIKKAAETILKNNAEMVIDTIRKDMEQHLPLPSVLSDVIIRYALEDGQRELDTPEEIILPEPITIKKEEWDPIELTLPIPAPEEEWIRRVARWIETRATGQASVPPSFTTDVLPIRKRLHIIRNVFAERFEKKKTEQLGGENEEQKVEKVHSAAAAL